MYECVCIYVCIIMYVCTYAIGYRNTNPLPRTLNALYTKICIYKNKCPKKFAKV